MTLRAPEQRTSTPSSATCTDPISGRWWRRTRRIEARPAPLPASAQHASSPSSRRHLNPVRAYGNRRWRSQAGSPRMMQHRVPELRRAADAVGQLAAAVHQLDPAQRRGLQIRGRLQSAPVRVRQEGHSAGLDRERARRPRSSRTPRLGSGSCSAPIARMSASSPPTGRAVSSLEGITRMSSLGYDVTK